MDRLSRICTLMVGVLVLTADGLAGAAGSSPEGTPFNMSADFHRLSGDLAANQMPMNIVGGDLTAVQLQFSNPPLELETVTLDGQDYVAPRLSGEGSTLEPGQPDLPRVTRLVMIANTGNVQLTIANQSYTVQQLDHAPAPMQPLAGDEGAPIGSIAYDSDVYNTNDWYPPQIAEVSPAATFRDVRFVVLITYPVQVNPVTREMRVYDNIEVALENVGGVGENEITVVPHSISPSFKRLYSEFPNFHGSPLDELPVVPGKQLIICPDDPSGIAEVQELVNWRRRKGIDAYYATTSTTGSTADQIRSYISTQYTQSDGALEFVTIIGDPNASAPYNIVTHGSQLDNYYGTMGGGQPDPVPDIAVGRLPATTATMLHNIVSMAIQYESDPYVADTTWFTRGWCAAHTSMVASNPSTKQYTRQIMLQHGLNPVTFDVFGGGMDQTTLNTRLNQGVCVFNDRMSWIGEFSPSQISGLSNGRKLPFVMVVTCETGTFNSSYSEALSEEFVRLGTAASPRGAIGAVGMAGSGTHVPYNNIVDAGVMYGMFALGIHEQGTALAAGKLQLYKNYAAYGHMNDVQNFSYWSNLMGDPAIAVWTKNPRAATITRPTSVNRYTDNVSVTVARAGTPLEGALVGLVKGTETFSRGYTDAAGNINLAVNLPTTGYLRITVTRDDLDTYQDSIQVVSAAASLSFNSNTVDDDNSGGTNGNSNGVLNPGETIDLNLSLRNTGTSSTVTGISGTLSTPMSGVQVVSGTRTYPDIPVGGTASPSSPYRIHVDAVFNNEPVPFYLTTTSSAGTQTIRMDLTPVSGDVSFVSSSFSDANSRLDPGDTGNLTVTFTNSGGLALSGATGILRSLDSHVLINDSSGTFGTVNAGANGVNTGDPFNVTASIQTVGGYHANMQLVILDASGFRDSTNFVQTVGIASSTTPTGPDDYGYYAYDNTETAPPGAASLYNWVEIAPGLGGPGTSLGFTDGGEDQDQSAVRTLPFTFRFYGQPFTQVTICDNGWIAFGSQTNTDFRNYQMGTPIGPTNQVAAYWDDLAVTGIANGGVYVWNNSSEGQYIIEWRCRTLWSSVDEVFEVILFDPAAYPSPTNDGKIRIQYQTVNMSANSGSNDNDYATLGIQNADHTIGLAYSYWNTYSPGAATMAAGRAIMYTTDITGGVLTSLSLMAPNGGETWYLHTNVFVTWIGGDQGDDIRVELSRSGLSGPWETVTALTPNDGSYNFVAGGPASTTCRVRILSINDPSEGDTSAADFAIAPLEILAPNGGEMWLTDSTVSVTWLGGDPAGNVAVDLSRNGVNGPWTALTASTPNDGVFTWVVSGALSSSCRVRVASLSDPLDADTSDGDFSIASVQLIFSEDFESGAPGWSHASAGGSWVDDWHVSTERAYDGTHSYKCGDTGTGQYSPLNDARLISPVITNLAANALLTFHHQISAELSSQYPDSAYDGGIVEISANGGAFTEISPNNGYSKTFRWESGSGNPATGPMPGQSCYSLNGDTAVWFPETFDLSTYAGQDVQLRFRFGSDQGVNNEGWYVDAIQIYAPVTIVEPVVPTELTLYQYAGNLVLRWASDSNTHYRIYSGPTPDNAMETLEGSTTDTAFTISGGAAATKRFYVVVGWDGN